MNKCYTPEIRQDRAVVEVDTSDLPTQPTELLSVFEKMGIESALYYHPPVFTVEESQAVHDSVPGGDCKSLFLKDKKGQLWLIVMLGADSLDMNAASKAIGSARLSFGKADLLFETLGVKPGSVTPFSAINDTEGRVNIILQKSMMEHDTLNYHPMINTMSCTISSQDLIRFLTEHNHKPQIIDLPLRS